MVILAELVAASMAHRDPRLERAVFGTDDPGLVAAAVETHVAELLGSPAATALFYRPGVGSVSGLELGDGRRVVVKVHRWEPAVANLAAVQHVQAHLADSGYPCPRPLAEPQPLGAGIATIEEHLGEGAVGDAHVPVVRAGLARWLWLLVEATRPLLGRVTLGRHLAFGLTDDRLWPPPHDLRFDFEGTAAGAEWIDELARHARRRLARPAGDWVIGHHDWRVENVGMDGADVVAVYDCDSFGLAPEPAVAASAAFAFSVDWADPVAHPLPTLDESRAFLEDYQRARGKSFSAAELDTADAAHLYVLAYATRCQHSDRTAGVVPDRGPGTRMAPLLEERGERWLPATL